MVPAEWWIEAAFAAWFFYLGASIGSFANVVAWRMPRGLPFAASTSKCPACGRRIPFWDNIPVLSWILLRGKCRQCKAKISIRYLLVELIYGFTFLTLYWIDLRLNQPGQSPYPSADLLGLGTLHTEQIVAFASHAALLSVLGIVWLIQYQRDSVPMRIWFFAVLVACAASIALPARHPSQFPSMLQSWNLLIPLLLVSIAASLCMDWLASRFARIGDRHDSPALFPSLSLVAAYLPGYCLLFAPAPITAFIAYRFLAPNPRRFDLVWTSIGIVFTYSILVLMTTR